MLDISLLTPEQVKWLNDYHVECREKLLPGIRAHGDDRAEQWLIRETEPLV